ncbi:MAG: hypothetical protein JNK99_11480 [Candidatus Accumulibacter sp.]|jgi:hypothetical protein|uniref:hypothetical protein n=1 Tax=Accumulibacter sp. TaxID=2053492 RepID=UPI001A462A84|nr:hypothetical protein [Accumulibacter sp.]MBL8395347.1 hypothetical protein [Accumulibacter sp.]
MSQNLVSLALSNDDLAALDAALATVEEKLAGLIELSVEQRRNLSKMGDKSEAFCRQALILLAENRQIIPPGLDLSEAEHDLRSLDQLRPRFTRLRRLAANADDTEMALGSDILDFALDGYAVAKVIGKGAALETMKEAMSARYTRRRSEPPKA